MASERDKLVEDKSTLEEELAVMKSQIHEFQVSNDAMGISAIQKYCTCRICS